MFGNLFASEGTYAKVMNRLWDFIVLSMLWVFCCLPIVTIGASSTAAYFAASKVLRHKTGKVTSEFFSSFRLNLRQSIVLTLTVGLVFVIVVLECMYVYIDPNMPLVMLYAFAMMAGLIGAVFSYLWSWLSRFSLSTFSFVRMAIIVTFRHLPTSILLLLIQLAVFFCVFLMPWGILIFPGLGFYLKTFPMEKILKKYSPKVSEDDPEASKWYYQ